MPWKTCEKDLKDVLNSCTYVRYDSKINDCRNKSTELGYWTSYNTQHETCHTFTLTPAQRKVDSIELSFEFDSCSLLRGVIHPAEEVYHLDRSINFINFQIHKGYYYRFKVSVIEFQKVNHYSSPCNQDPEYRVPH